MVYVLWYLWCVHYGTYGVCIMAHMVYVLLYLWCMHYGTYGVCIMAHIVYVFMNCIIFTSTPLSRFLGGRRSDCCRQSFGAYAFKGGQVEQKKVQWHYNYSDVINSLVLITHQIDIKCSGVCSIVWCIVWCTS